MTKAKDLDISASTLARLTYVDGRLFRDGNRAGTKNKKGYIRLYLDGRLYYASRVIWLLHYGEWPKGEIDHINRKKDDDRIENFRVVSRSGNLINRVYAKSGFKGVHQEGSRWRARIRINRQSVHLGMFATKEEASVAYLRAEAERISP